MIAPARFARTARISPVEQAGCISGPYRQPLAERIARAIVSTVVAVLICAAVAHCIATWGAA